MSSNGFTVRLERVFQGPMDLLLHLVREQEVEIHEIEISTVIEGYLEYLNALHGLDIEVAGDFLVMAATLMSIKSRSLLPRESVDLEDDLDPRDELIQRLIEYRRFREASDRLGERYEIRARMHLRGASGFEEPKGERELDLGEITQWDLLSAFSRLMHETLGGRPHTITVDTRPLRWFVNEMAHKVRAARSISLRDLVLSLDAELTRETLVGGFCALLELCKLGLVCAVQETKGGEILLELQPEHFEDMDDVIRDSVFDDEVEPEEPVAASATAPTDALAAERAESPLDEEDRPE